ncbi:MAG: nucleoside deaminase [Saprospiraceae bacterium]
MPFFTDDYFMDLAIREAKAAAEEGEIPVGAILVSGNQILAKTHNQTELLHDVTAHAEILAITAGSEFLGSKYLPDCTLYVTLEPCPMCAGALRWAQLGRLVYAAADEKNGYMNFGSEMLHPKTSVAFGVRMDICGNLMTEFFREKRN